MSEHETPEPLGPAAAALLEAERSRPEQGGAMADRVLARLAMTLGPPAGPQGGGDPGGGAAANGAPAASAMKSMATSKLAAIVLGAFSAGIGVGAVGHATLATSGDHALPPPIAQQTAAPVPPSPIATTSAMPEVVASAAPALPSAKVAPPTTKARATDEKDPALGRERAWIEQARMAIARGSPADALAALDGHAREFPSGRMAEEREALAVHALAAAGRADEAKARAQSFRRKWPSSVFTRLVDRATGLAP